MTDLILNQMVYAVMFPMYVIFITNVSISLYSQTKTKKLLLLQKQNIRPLPIAFWLYNDDKTGQDRQTPESREVFEVQNSFSCCRYYLRVGASAASATV
jgi:hypothetical protein